MKISVLTPDVSHNCLGRAYLLAQILQRQFEVEIIGPAFSPEIWYPLAHLEAIPYKSIELKKIPYGYWQLIDLSKDIDGDIIYASKPLMTSFGLGLISKLSHNRPLVLDIDDWQLAQAQYRYRRIKANWKNVARNLVIDTLKIYSVSSLWNSLIFEKLRFIADEITVSNHFLSNKFGGKVIWHARDTDAFNPDLFDAQSIRKKLDIDLDRKVVMFLGTPRSHKGVFDLIKAVKLLDCPNVLLVIVGEDEQNYVQAIIQKANQTLGRNFRSFGMQEFEKIPEFLAIADLIVIPQQNSPFAMGQMPAKVFDAMAMAKPIVATNVSDLPRVLDGCGWIVEPQNPEQLAETIQAVLNDSDRANKAGQKARRKCIEHYSFDAMERELCDLFQPLIK